MNVERPISDDAYIKAIGGTICKAILYICISVLAGLWLSDCNLDSEIIESCKSACSKVGSQMESVTPGKCVCGPTNDFSSKRDIWVIPKVNSK